MKTLITRIEAKWYFIAAITLLAIPYLALILSIVINFDRIGGVVSYLNQQISATSVNATFTSWLDVAAQMGCDTVIIYILTVRIVQLCLLFGLIFRRQWARVGLLWFIPIILFVDLVIVPLLAKCYLNKSSMPWGFRGIEAVILAIFAWGLLMHPKTNSHVSKIASNKPLQSAA